MPLVLVDKPGGMTSHDVVARARRVFATPRVGHAGTLDPMATGLLVLGVGGATRLLTYLVGLGKTYEATIRLGASTTTDDAEGETTSRADAAALATVDDEAIAAGIGRLTGRISQIPSSVSAIKVDGRRAYDRVRAGEEVVLAAREVTVDRFEVAAIRREPAAIDVDVVVDCSTGTYIRALARDLGADLGVGGHLTALRRTRVGPFDVAGAAPLDDLLRAPLDPAVAMTEVLGGASFTAEETVALRQGKRIAGAAARLDRSPAAALDPDGALIGVVERRGDDVKAVMNLAEEPA